MAYQRPRTLQGGNGRSFSPGGVPNAAGRGITNQYLGHNPIGHSLFPQAPRIGGIRPNFHQPTRPRIGNNPPGPAGGPGTGGNGGGGLGGIPGFHPGAWMPSTYHGGNNPGLGQGQGGGGVNNTGQGNNGGQNNPGNPWDPNVINDVLNGTGDYAKLMQKLGMPLDPQFLMQRTDLVNNRDSALTQLMNQMNVGNAQLDQQSVLGQRSIAENDAARGVFGSGIQVRDNRLLGNNIAQQRLGLQSAYDQGTLGANTDYRSQMMQALTDLASRLQGQQNLPLPNWGPWAQGTNRHQQSQTPQRPRQNRRGR